MEHFPCKQSYFTFEEAISTDQHITPQRVLGKQLNKQVVTCSVCSKAANIQVSVQTRRGREGGGGGVGGGG